MEYLIDRILYAFERTTGYAVVINGRFPRLVKLDQLEV